MKCELCHKGEAETAIMSVDGGDELYVCRECARREKARRRNGTRAVRKSAAPPVPPAAAAQRVAPRMQPPAPARLSPMREASLARVPESLKMAGALHLEALFLMGDLDAVERAMDALGVEMVPFALDGLPDAGHAYFFKCRECDIDMALRAIGDLAKREEDTRAALEHSYPLVFGDALCRALSILKNCRLLSSGELFDLLSPLRIAVAWNLLEGIDAKTIDRLAIEAVQKTTPKDLSPDERDRMDAELADRMNERFENVVISDNGEAKFL